VGGGLELALRADVVFAGESARFAHSEQSIGIVTLLGGVYRVAAKVGRAKAMEWAMTSDMVSSAEMERYGVINHVCADTAVLEEAMAFAHRIARGPTLAHAAHKALLKVWTSGGIAAADEVLLDLAVPLFASADAKLGIAGAVAALESGRSRPIFDFKGE
jgi:enoyl-CoA hydratase/carnithine racemase